MFGRESRLPDQLHGYLPPTELEQTHEYVIRIKERLEQAHEELRQLQLQTRHDEENSHLYLLLEKILWLENRWRRKRSYSKLLPKICGTLPHKGAVSESHILDRITGTITTL